MSRQNLKTQRVNPASHLKCYAGHSAKAKWQGKLWGQNIRAKCQDIVAVQDKVSRHNVEKNWQGKVLGHSVRTNCKDKSQGKVSRQNFKTQRVNPQHISHLKCYAGHSAKAKWQGKLWGQNIRAKCQDKVAVQDKFSGQSVKGQCREKFSGQSVRMKCQDKLWG